MNNNGFSFVFNQDFAINKNKTDKLIEAIQKRSKEIFELKFCNHIKNKGEKSEGKLVFYSKIKVKYSKELYLSLENDKNRNAIRNIRISTHKLNIETGRYNGINRNERFCDLCSINVTESEEHFLVECPIYKNERTSFLSI